MFYVIKRKNVAVILACVTALCVLGISLNTTPETIQTQSETVDENDMPELGDSVLVSSSVTKIESVKNEREIMRSKMCALLTENIDNPNISEEAKSDYENKLLLAAENMDKELNCESLLALKGYENTVVFISDEIITVSVDKKNITGEDVSKINDIIFDQTGNNNIKIVEVK